MMNNGTATKGNLHVIGLPHNDANVLHTACAYGQKHRKFVPMMLSLGYKVYSYYGEHSDMDATEHVVVSSDADKRRWFGEFDHHKDFYPITWGVNDIHWVEMNNNVIEKLRTRLQPRDIICLIGGVCQQGIARAFPNHLVCEYGIGYSGYFSPYKIFESNPHMHWCYGNQGTDSGGFYDAVIPNFFDPEEFILGEPQLNLPDEYYVFLGRLIERKGWEIAVEVTARLGKKLILAGQGLAKQETIGDVTTITSTDGMSLSGDHIQHIGHVDIAQRAELLAGAKATFMPTTYLEPFGGVSIESLLCGTPVIASDFGCFTSTIPHGLAGYRFRTIGEATQFASDEYLDKLDRNKIKEYATANFSVDRVKYLYDDYFKQLGTLWNEGFYTHLRTSDDRYSIFT